MKANRALAAYLHVHVYFVCINVTLNIGNKFTYLHHTGDEATQIETKQ